jgi:hypothetical protein
MLGDGHRDLGPEETWVQAGHWVRSESVKLFVLSSIRQES